MDWRGLATGAWTHKNKLTVRKTTFLVIENYIEDVKQDRKMAPDLVERTMKGSGIVKESPRLISFEISQLRSRITKSPKVQSPKNWFADHHLPILMRPPSFSQYLATSAANYLKKHATQTINTCMFQPLWGWSPWHA